MSPAKNALIIEGKTFVARRRSYLDFSFDPCQKCALQKRCEKNQSNFCAPFEKKGYVPYFVKG